MEKFILLFSWISLKLFSKSIFFSFKLVTYRIPGSQTLNISSRFKHACFSTNIGYCGRYNILHVSLSFIPFSFLILQFCVNACFFWFIIDIGIEKPQKFITTLVIRLCVKNRLNKNSWGLVTLKCAKIVTSSREENFNT